MSENLAHLHLPRLALGRRGVRGRVERRLHEALLLVVGYAGSGSAVAMLQHDSAVRPRLSSSQLLLQVRFNSVCRQAMLRVTRRSKPGTTQHQQMSSGTCFPGVPCWSIIPVLVSRPSRRSCISDTFTSRLLVPAPAAGMSSVLTSLPSCHLLTAV